MTYSPYSDSGWPTGRTSPHGHYMGTNEHMDQSPFSPTMSSAPTSPDQTKGSPSLDSLGKALSNTAYPAPSSPARSSYDSFKPQAMREPHHSHRSCRDSNSRCSYPTSPQPWNQTRDVEKQHPRHSQQSRHSASSRTKSQGYTTSNSADPDAVDDVLLESKALKILIYLAVFSPLVSLIIFLYTFFAIMTIILLQPFRLCTKSTTFRQQVISFLSPTLKIQMAFIYSSIDPEEYTTLLLIMIILLSPIVSFGVAMAAWVAGAFWFFNAILGDPDGSDKPRGYNDGRASVIGVRKWWERWLTRALR